MVCSYVLNEFFSNIFHLFSENIFLQRFDKKKEVIFSYVPLGVKNMLGPV
jgi:hypothetical protein